MRGLERGNWTSDIEGWALDARKLLTVYAYYSTAPS